MASSSPESTLFRLTPLDNNIGSRYIQLALFFPASSSDLSSLVQNITSGLTQTFSVIPLLAGTITHLPDTRLKGRLAITGPWRHPEDAISVKELRNTAYPSYQTLRSKHFPLEDIDYNIFSPTRVDERPVLQAQISSIEGGMVLGILFDHSFTDGIGAVTVARVWAAYCRGEDGSQLISPELMDSTQLSNGDESARIEEFKEFVYCPEARISVPAPGFLNRMFLSFPSFRSPFDFGLNFMRNLQRVLRGNLAGATSRSDPNLVIGEIFFIPEAKLKELKGMASNLESDETSWISTHDAIASLIWCCVTAAHKTDIPNEFESTKDQTCLVKEEVDSSVLLVVVNGRPLMKPPLPVRYVGNCVFLGHIIKPLSTVVPTAEDVTTCAHSLRHKLKQYNDGVHLSRLIGALKSVPDSNKWRLHRMGFDQNSLVFNSWATQEWYDIDWGTVVGGRCQRVRIPHAPFGNFCLVLPALKGSEGNKETTAGLEVYISIKSRYMDILREDGLFNRFAEWRCN